MDTGALSGESAFEDGDSNLEKNFVCHDGGLFALRQNDVAGNDKAHGAAQHHVAWKVIAAGDARERNGPGQAVSDKWHPAVRAITAGDYRRDGHGGHGVFGVETTGMKRIVVAIEKTIRIGAVARVGEWLAARGDGFQRKIEQKAVRNGFASQESSAFRV